MIVSIFKQGIRQRRNRTMKSNWSRHGRHRLQSERLEPRRLLATFTVDSTSDVVDTVDGITTLREAIIDANATPNVDAVTPDLISFNIPGPGPHTIRPLAGLPEITDPVVIDGYTQPGASANTNPPHMGTNATILIEIDGSLIVTIPELEPNGLKITTGDSTVRGLAINRFTGGDRAGTSAAIRLGGNGGNTIEGNFLGADVTGMVALPNTRGIEASFAGPNNLIGGNTPAARNVISGNDDHGLLIRAGADSTIIQGNLIGTDASGTSILGNNDGIAVTTSSNSIGGTTAVERNVISGNRSTGLHISAASNNVVQGNYIGTDVTGVTQLGNAEGVHVGHQSTVTFGNTIGGTAPGAGNVISGNTTWGLALTNGAYDNYVEGNFIGTDIGGLIAVPNDGGVFVTDSPDNIIGGNTAAARNIISGNSGNGVRISGAEAIGNRVQGNYVGTDLSGELPISNNGGIQIATAGSGNIVGGGNAGEGNVVAASVYYGVGILETDNSIVQGNLIGTNAYGTTAMGNGNYGVYIRNGSQNVVGGSNVGEGNLVSGNTAMGVFLENSSNNVLQGNFIGVDVSGTVALGNRDGIRLIGSSHNTIGGLSEGAGNLVSGNVWEGIQVSGGENSHNLVLGNFVGTDVSGELAVPNGRFGISFGGETTHDNVIGGTTPAARNIISGNGSNGVVIAGVSNVVQGNYVGTDVSGTIPVPNAIGINVSGNAFGNLIGGVTSGAGNLISGNINNGIRIGSSGPGSLPSQNIVQGNFIGTDVTGMAALPNVANGVFIEKSGQNTIGGNTPAARNIISGNGSGGVYISGTAAADNRVRGNYIGTDVTGTAAVPNNSGITIIDSGPENRIGGDAPGEGNLISANNFTGVTVVRTDASVVQGNFIGTDATGTAALGNGWFGIWTRLSERMLIGGDSEGARNLVSGNSREGVFLQNSHFTTVQANYIGVDISGTVAIGNLDGILLAGSANNTIGGTASGTGNVISGNAFQGIQMSGGGNLNNVVQGNLIGTDATGTTSVGNGSTGISLGAGADDNLIGGTAPEARNIISGNRHGVAIGVGGISSSNIIQGNFIGTNISGTSAVPNLSLGISVEGHATNNVIGGTVPGARNLISGNLTTGIAFGGNARENRVVGNAIGTDASGLFAVGNGVSGVQFQFGSTDNNAIGGDAPGEGNIIAYNGMNSSGHGIHANSGIGNTFRGNSIHSNEGLGIDLAPVGVVTANDPGDADTGANNLQNFPVITFSEDGLTTHVVGTLNSLPDELFTLDFYANTVADPSGHGEGERHLGSHDVMTDSLGNADFNVFLLRSSTAGEFISATATGPDGTSEFSGVEIIESSNTAPTVVAGGPYAVDEGGSVQLDASGTSDAEQDASTLAYEWDLDGDGIFGETGAGAERGNETGPTPTFSAAGLDGPGQVEVLLRVTDSGGLQAVDMAIIDIANVDPSVDVVDLTDPVFAVGDNVTVSALISDPGIPDTFTVEWTFTSPGATPVTATQTDVANDSPVNQVDTTLSFDQPGVYRAVVTVTDDDNGSHAATMEALIVVYDPSGGFVTGGGWIDSPAGAYAADPTLTGRAKFGFVSKYQNGASTPTGQTEFQFKVADLNFHSESYQWLVVAGARAQYKGAGTINGQGNYGFLLTAIDGQLNGGGGEDKFRIKIWDKNNGDAIVYDNQVDDDDDSYPTTLLGGGSIKIHKDK